MNLLLALLSLTACHETPQFEAKHGDVPTRLLNSYISLPDPEVSYASDDEHFPVNLGQENNYYIPAETGWNFYDRFGVDEAGMALYLPDDVYFSLTPSLNDLPEQYDSPRFHITTQEATAILMRRNCEIEIPIQITTETLASKTRTCGTTPLTSEIHEGYFDADSLLISLGEYTSNSDCSMADIIPENMEESDVCIGFAVETPDLFDLAVETYKAYAELWE